MKFSFAHNNINVKDFGYKFYPFYKDALGSEEVGHIDGEDGSFKIVYLGDGTNPHRLELTWLRDWDRPYNLGDNEFHVAFYVDDYAGALAKHKAMNCVVYENEDVWAFILLLIQMDIGLKLSQQEPINMEHMLTRLQWLVGEEKLKLARKKYFFWMRWCRLLA